MKNLLNPSRSRTLSQALIAGFVSVNLAAIGMVELFGERYLVTGILTMGQVVFLLAPAAFSFFAVRGTGKDWKDLLKALTIGLVAGFMLLLFIWLAVSFPVRSVLLNVSPSLIDLLTFGLGTFAGSLALLGVTVAVSLLAAAMNYLPQLYGRAILYGFSLTLLLALLSQILVERIRNFFGQQAIGFLFSSGAFKPLTALVLFILLTALFIALPRLSKPKAAAPKPRVPVKLARQLALSLLLLALPFFLGTYLTEVTNNVGLFLLMGLGLNIVVGLAGLLDLGYVAFFAIGAYTMAVLTSTGPLGLGLSFWFALPICVVVAALAGLVLGIPVLKMRGDYLAIVTLGFGEIIRILALSDLLKPYIGGAQGVLQIPKPSLFGLVLSTPEKLYYVILGCALLAAFISNRLRESRLGRSWIAIREDEDVAEAMGINLVRTKLMAFAIGAGFSGLAGAIFAPKLTSIFPHSFSFLISINVLSLIIVGGLGSIPGTIVGAIVLVGLPELLREFAEFRWLVYGALLVMMMLTRPEGFIPSDIMRRELHAGDSENVSPS
ncbi:MAG: hypothetical protein WD751_05000 [Anaerolineales bacterium]